MPWIVGVIPDHNEGVDPAALTDAEHLLWEAFRTGTWPDLIAAGVPPLVRADVIAALLLGAGDPEPGRATAVRLRAATVTGRLDLAGGSAAWPAIFENCHFDSEPCFADSSARTVRIVNSELPGFHGTRLRLDGILDLAGTRLSGSVRLERAVIDGQMIMHGARVKAALENHAVLATGLVVRGDLDCRSLETDRPVSFESSAVEGAADFTGASISCPDTIRALDLAYADFGGKLDCHDLVVRGEMLAMNCRVAGQLSLSGSSLENPGGRAFSGGGIDVGAGLYCHRVHARGEFRLLGARVAKNLAVEGSIFDNPDGMAINLERAVLGVLDGENLECVGQLSMTRAHVDGDANLAGSLLKTGAGRTALNAGRARIEGMLTLADVTVSGEMNLRIIHVGERLLLIGANLSDPRGTACRLTRASVSADLRCSEMRAEGRVKLFGAAVGGTVSFDEARLSNAAGNALEAEHLQAQRLNLMIAAVDGGMDLSHAAVGVLADSPEGWPSQLRLEGLKYQALAEPLSAAQRLRWLALDPGGHQPQPYEQLAAYYGAIGRPAQAREVLYAREKIQNRARGPILRMMGLLQDAAVGYGYRPRRALAWLALLLVTGSVVFSVAPPPPLQPTGEPHFNGIVYTVDLMLPVVNLGQKYAFNPGGAEQWLSYVLIAAGWILATTVAAGAARVLRRG